jgi:hypothetical protein
VGPPLGESVSGWALCQRRKTVASRMTWPSSTASRNRNAGDGDAGGASSVEVFGSLIWAFPKRTVVLAALIVTVLVGVAPPGSVEVQPALRVSTTL